MAWLPKYVCSPSSHVSHLVPAFDQRRVLEEDWEEGGGRNGETGYLASMATAESPLRFLLLGASPALRLRSHQPLPLLLSLGLVVASCCCWSPGFFTSPS